MRLTRPALLAATALLALYGPTATAQGQHGPLPEPAVPKAAETLTYVTGDPVYIPAEYPAVLHTARANCPSGQVPTGGGMTTYGNRFSFSITSSYAQGGSWIVTGRSNESLLRDGSIAATVVCSPAPHHQVFGGRVTLERGQVVTLHQPCPSGEVPTGGGGRGDAERVAVQSSLPALNTWEVSYWNDTGQTHTVEPFVVCSTAPHHAVAGRAGSITRGGTGTSQVQCPDGQQVTGGGGFSKNDTEIILTSFEGNGWRATSAGFSPDFQQVTAFAVCTGS